MPSSLMTAGGGLSKSKLRLADAEDGNVLINKTFYGGEDKLIRTGTMPDNGAVDYTVAPGSSVTIPAGYHNGNGVVRGTMSGMSNTLWNIAKSMTKTRVVTPGTTSQSSSESFFIGTAYQMYDIVTESLTRGHYWHNLFVPDGTSFQMGCLVVGDGTQTDPPSITNLCWVRLFSYSGGKITLYQTGKAYYHWNDGYFEGDNKLYIKYIDGLS